MGGYDGLGTIFWEDPFAINVVENRITNNKARPLFPNTKYYPLKQEVVLIIKTMSKNIMSDPKSVTGKSDTENYYITNINFWNHPHHNALPQSIIYPDNEGETTNASTYQLTENGIVLRGLTEPTNEDEEDNPKLGEYFKERSRIQTILPYEGDHILEGRFGNSIRFGSTTSPDLADRNAWSGTSIGGEDSSDNSKKGKIGDPVIIIRNGQKIDENTEGQTPIIENINTDDSSIYMTSNHKIENLEVAGAKEASKHVTPFNSYEGRQTLIGTAWDYTVKAFTFTKEVVVGTVDNVNEGANVFNAVKNASVDTYEEATNPESIESYTSSFVAPPPDDGLSFYDEMVNSGVADDDDFDNYETTFENIEVSGTVLSEEGELENENASNDPSKETYGHGDVSSPLDYPATIKYKQNHDPKYSITLQQPLMVEDFVQQYVIPAPKASTAQSQRLCLHTCAMNTTHIGLAHYFLQEASTKKGKTGWSKHGYHITIEPNGTCVRVYPDSERSYGVGSSTSITGDPATKRKNFSNHSGAPVENSNTINITWIGGASSVWNMTKPQAHAMNYLVTTYVKRYPHIQVVGHNQFRYKACPIFYVPAYCKHLGINKNNIWEFPDLPKKDSNGHKNDHVDYVAPFAGQNKGARDYEKKSGQKRSKDVAKLGPSLAPYVGPAIV